MFGSHEKWWHEVTIRIEVHEVYMEEVQRV